MGLAKLNALRITTIMSSDLCDMLEYLKMIYKGEEIPNFNFNLSNNQFVGVRVYFGNERNFCNTFTGNIYCIIQEHQIFIPKYLSLEINSSK